MKLLKLTVPFLFIALLSPPLFAQHYQLKDRYGRNQRVEVKRNCIRQYDRRGQIENSYKIQRNKVYQFDRYGKRK